jgi:pimeloyl-ACP methyl ester carboxylesterase
MTLLNPPPLRELIMQHYGWWNLWLGAGLVAGGIPPELDSLVNGAKITAPAIFLSASRDGIVPPRFHRMVYDAYTGPKRFIPLLDAGHNEMPEPSELPEYRAAIDWLWSRVQTAAIE